MSKGFMTQINLLINEADIILEVLDARFPEKTRNKRIEEIVKRKEKKLIFVINKADLSTKKKNEKEKKKIIEEEEARVVFVSAKEKKGINLLKKEIQMAKGNKKEINIGLLGYPNSGKSSIINTLSGKGKGKVRTSSKAGYTRGLQKIKISDGAYLIDAPGIIPYEERDEFDLFLLGAKNANQLKDIETAAVKLISEMKEKIEEKFNVKGDEEEILEAIALEKKFFKSGGKGDTEKTARFLLEEYQKNEL
jgi:ribosome biogenesis GTPase A